MEALNLRLIKTVDYNLKPFGKFYFKWKKGKEVPRHIWIGELTIMVKTRMPLLPEQEKSVILIMKKNKTEVLTQNGGAYQRYYTRINHDLVEIAHRKIEQYKNDEVFRSLIDNR